MHLYRKNGFTPCGMVLYHVRCTSTLEDVTCGICLLSGVYRNLVKKQEKNKQRKKLKERKGSIMSSCDCAKIVFSDGAEAKLSKETEASIKESLGIKPPKRFNLWTRWELCGHHYRLIPLVSTRLAVNQAAYVGLMHEVSGRLMDGVKIWTMVHSDGHNSVPYVSWLPCVCPEVLGETYKGYGINDMKKAIKCNDC